MLIMVMVAVPAMADRKEVYLGGGRSVCQGSDCGNYNAQQRRFNYEQERIDQQERDRRHEEIEDYLTRQSKDVLEGEGEAY
ncbi:hypothetical protein [Methylobacillus sp.]|uniref:hypothetical protein n=1 Tax=Methylobacillus sp. TaxID=56818 RepID=UPI0012C643F2|nr:hypothetical protein [Methylobacillus sp.]MPS48497.1 hypothetical protein [Methylobacillus sp.]